MKTMIYSIIFATLMPLLANARGQCVPSPWTPRHQAQFCHLASQNNCANIGCEWREIRYRCQPGPYTPRHMAPFCAAARDENCEAIGCEWGYYYAPSY